MKLKTVIGLSLVALLEANSQTIVKQELSGTLVNFKGKVNEVTDKSNYDKGIIMHKIKFTTTQGRTYTILYKPSSKYYSPDDPIEFTKKFYPKIKNINQIKDTFIYEEE